MNILKAFGISAVLLAVFIALDMTGVTRGVPNFVIEVAMLVPILAIIAYLANRKQSL